MTGWTSHPEDPDPMNSADCRRYRRIADKRMRGQNDDLADAVWSRMMEDRFPVCTERVSRQAWRHRLTSGIADAILEPKGDPGE